MINDTRANQVRQIVKDLASLPGGQRVDISFRKYPRFGPAEPGTPFMASTRSFDVHQVPEAAAVPSDAEDVTICLRGSLGGTLHRDLLVDELEALFEQAHLHEGWDVRVNFRQNEDRLPLYELTVSSHDFHAAQVLV
jgi:hypothetical protein